MTQITRDTMIAALKEIPQGATREQLAKRLGTKSEAIKDLLKGLKAEGVVGLDGDRRGAKYSIRTIGENAIMVEPVAIREAKPVLDINKRFGMMDKLVKAMVQGANNSMIVTGQGGTGKTSTILKTLESMGLEPRRPGQVCNAGEHYLHVKGAAAATELYRIFFEYPDALIIFDDCDSVFNDGNGMNVLKAVLDTFESRTVSWISNYVQKTMGLPESFEFKGKVIFVTNRPNINQALMSRSLNVDLNMTQDELIDRVDAIGMQMNPEITETEHKALVTFLRENATKFADLSLRTYIKIANLITSGESDWQDLALWSN